ncbi:alpha/beta fold hydrolase [Pelagibacteraceae bacterium]|nr:alpha/beta fold hydrolase [Pelagibacteraceae bacterium]
MPFYKNKQNHKIAYKSLKGRGLGIIFIHGLNSDMNGAKALTVEKYARKNNLNFIRFDCRGHGKSHGRFEEFTISDWRKDLLNIIDYVARGPQILIGSSMGGWLMMLAAKARPQRIKGMIGLAAAPDFGKDLYNSLNKKNKKEITTKGITKYSSYGFSYYLTKRFFIEAEKNRVLKNSFRFTKPLVLIHGIKDNIVKEDVPRKILKKVTGKNINIIFLKESDHRLSSKTDLKMITQSIDYIQNLNNS